MKLKVTFLLKGDSNVGSSRIRAIQFFDYFKANGVAIDVYRRSDINKAPYKFLFWLSFIKSSLTSSHVFLQKPILNRFVVYFLRYIKAKIILDFDDAIWVKSSDDDLNKISSNLFDDNLMNIFKLSSLIICGSDYLKNTIHSKYNDGKYCVLRPSVFFDVNQQYNLLTNKSSNIVIGWIGNSINLSELELLLPVFFSIKNSYSVNFIICSDRLPEKFSSVFNFLPWSLENEKVFFNNCDIGIMPLKRNHRSLGRCGFKAIQYMANGIPVIASDYGISKEIIKNGINGYLCESPHDWYISLCNLIKHEKERLAFGRLGKRFVVKYCNANKTQETLLNIFMNQSL